MKWYDIAAILGSYEIARQLTSRIITLLLNANARRRAA